jgi:ABC-type transport system involved in cytochrome c biogenesis permease subunit
MATDYLITAGLIVGLFSVPAMLAAYADSRFPRNAMAAFILSAAVITVAIILNPARYSAADLPNVVIRVIGDIIH